ncbi:MAG: ATP-binding protein, partial [Planctomycetota bacterium]|nr:ATP-binding protein [Planctomycetota bacterium]
QIAVLREEIGRLDCLLSDFLAFARPMKLSVSVNDVNRLLTQVAEEFRPDVAGKDISIELNLDDRLSSCPFDWEHIHQVLVNLLSNALSEIDGGGTVTLSSALSDSLIRLQVSDTGPGIPTDNNIFEPFVTTKSKGTGLGLSIARRIVEAHSGTISARNTDVGSAFLIELPSKLEA